MKYIGKSFLPDVPARDLTDKEVEKFGRDFLLASGLYVDEAVEKKPQKESK